MDNSTMLEFVPQDDITALDVALVLKTMGLAIDAAMIPEEIEKHFKETDIKDGGN